MHPEPREPNNVERRQDLYRQEEALRLRQEEARLERAKQSYAYVWIVNSIYVLVGLLEILLGLRLLLRLTGANPDNSFANFIYNFSEPFMAPFSTLFISPTAGGGANIFDVNLIIAIIVYALLGWLGLWLTRYFFGR
jgi:uncharacterized protein YggT (Ycf19 family)